PSRIHGYTPHCTLAYLDPKARNPVDRLPDIDLTFGSVTIVHGSTRIDIPVSDLVAMYAVKDEGARPVLHTYQPVMFAEPPEWSPFLPVPDVYHHPIYGQLNYTPEYYEE